MSIPTWRSWLGGGRGPRSLALAAALLGLAAPHAWAQRPGSDDGATPLALAPGTPLGTYALTDLDSINYFSGGLHFALPLVQVGGRGSAHASLPLVIERHWSLQSEETPDPDRRHYFATRNSWDYHSPAFKYGLFHLGVVEARHTFEFLGDFGCGVPNAWNTLTHLIVTAPDGSESVLRDVLTDGQPQRRCPGNPPFNRGTLWVSRDGSASTFLADQPIVDSAIGGEPVSDYPSGVLLLRDGTRYRVESGRVRRITDRNGNFIELQPANEGSRIVDSAGRVVTFSRPIPPLPNTDLQAACGTIGFQGFRGAAREVVVQCATLGDVIGPENLRAFFPRTPGDLYDPTVVSAVRLPDGREYTFHYNPLGELERVDLPTGGALEYSYASGLQSGADADGFFTFEGPYLAGALYRRVVERRVYGASALEQLTRIARPETLGPEPAPDYVEVTQHDPTDPGIVLGRQRHFFDGRAVDTLLAFAAIGYDPWKFGRERKTEVFDTDGRGGAFLNRTERTWVQRSPVAWWTQSPDSAPPSDPRLVEIRTTLDTNQVTRQIFDYDAYNNVTLRSEYDFGPGAHGPLLRHRQTDYVTVNGGRNYATDLTIHIRNLPAQERLYDELVAERARTTYEYDAYGPDAVHAPLLDRANLTGHDPEYGSGRSARGNVTGVWRRLDALPAPVATYQQYDVVGNVVRSIDGRGFATQLFYEDRFGAPGDGARGNEGIPGGFSTYAHLTRTVDALSHETFTQFDYSLGRPVDHEDENGVVGSAFYDDALDRPTASVRADGRPEQNQVRFAYDDSAPNPHIDTYRDQEQFQAGELHTSVSFDALGRRLSTLSFGDPTGTIVSGGVNYDARGLVGVAYNPLHVTAPPLPAEPLYATTTQYDGAGRVLQVKAPDQAIANTTYSGSATTFTDPAGKRRVVDTDGLGRTVRVVEDPAGLNYVTSYAYNVFDRVVRVDQGGQQRTFAYDSLGRLVCASNPEGRVADTSCATPSLPASGVNRFAYDANGNLVERRDARGRVSTFTYDALNRVATKTYSDGTPPVTYTYDAPAVPFSKGRLTGVSSSVSTMAYREYDPLGRIKRSRQDVGAQSYLMSYTYDLADHLRSQTYPSGRVVTTAYDGVGRFSRVWEGNLNYARVSSDPADNGYAAHGGLLKMLLGNGRWQHARYNCRLQPILAGLGSSTSSADFLAVAFDFGTNSSCHPGPANNGDVRGQSILIAGTPPKNFAQSFGYDGVNRLLTASEVSTVTGGQSWTQTFAYDRFGNRALTAGLALQPALTPRAVTDFDPATNHIVGRTYDPAGNLTTDGLGRTFTFDAEGRQVQAGGTAGSITYAYDGEGRRISKTVSGSTNVYVYDAFEKLVAEYGSAPLLDTLYLTPDGLGSNRLVSDSQGSVVYRLDYLPFGEEIPAAQGGRSTIGGYGTNPGLRFKFTGKERDTETDLDFFSTRYYSASPGRFGSPDAQLSSGRPEIPQSWNRYAYVLNNPLKFTDPSGGQEVLPGSECAFDESGECSKAQLDVIKGFLKQVVNILDLSGPANATFRMANVGMGLGDMELIPTFKASNQEQQAGMLTADLASLLMPLLDGVNAVRVLPEAGSAMEALPATADTAYAGVRELSQTLRAAGVDRRARLDAIGSFRVNSITPRTALGDEVFLRYFGGEKSLAEGRFLTPTFPPTGSARSMLALPPDNLATGLAQFRFAPGTRYFQGTVGPNFNLPGGGVQVYILDKGALVRVR